MSDELFHKTIEESKYFGNPEIFPFLNGEPFMFSRIWEWLDYLEKENCRTYIVTNAELVDVDRLVKYKNIRCMWCSVNAATEETHKKIMRGPNFNKVVSNVEDLIKKAPFKVYVSMVVVKDNKHEVGAFKKRWGKRATLSEFKNWGGDRHDPLEKTGARVPCISLLRGMTILWDGRVSLCCLDYDGKLILGDANKQPLSEIYQSLLQMRNKHKALDFDYEPCRRCNQNICVKS
jgi:MoaA/NifB/PqqE/SkfB family radical SAM enzyme